MIIVKIKGGLGNQIFQYAYAKSLHQRGFNVKIDISAFKSSRYLKKNHRNRYFLDRYQIDLEPATLDELQRYGVLGILSKLRNKFGFKNNRFVQQRNFTFDDELMFIGDDKYIDGYFQSEKYFLKNREVLLSQISLKDSMSTYGSRIQREISTCKLSCSIHIRRGDYLGNKTPHAVLDITYYTKCIEMLEKRFSKNVHYYIFSEDLNLDWVVDNFNLKNSTFIESDQDRCPNEDIFLMSLCDHNIIANSSYSWWGAWLNKNVLKRVYAPSVWLSDKKNNDLIFDLIPKSWIRV